MNDDADFYARYGEALKLCGEARAELAKAGGSDPSIYLKKFGNVEKVFQRPLGESVQSAQGLLDESTWLSLEIGCHRAVELAPQYGFAAEQLQSLKVITADLIGAVEASELPPDLRGTILFHLRSVSRSLDDFELFGAKEVRSEVEALVGSIAIENLASSKQPVAKIPIVKRVLEYSRDTVVVLNLVKGVGDACQLGTEVVTALLPAPDQIP